MQIIGRLQFLTWDRPWLIDDVDLRRTFWDFAAANKDKRASQEYGRDEYKLIADATAECALEFDQIGAGVLLVKKSGFGFSNAAVFLEYSMHALNGRRVIANVSETAFSITADPTENIFGVKYFGRGNSCRVPADAERIICKVGTADACLFATCGPDGFGCEKFSGSTTRYLLERKATGTIRAQRIGNCRNIGREAEGGDQ